MFLQKTHELVTKTDSSEEESALKMLFSNTQSVCLGGFENDTFLFSKDESTVLGRQTPNCQVHTQQVSLQCLSTENIPLSQTTIRWGKLVFLCVLSCITVQGIMNLGVL